jgi:hypothetical protein
MKVSGFAIVRNALLMGYPARESIESVLPICDEFIVNLGRSEDDSLALVRSIGSPKVRIVETAWEEDLRESGRVLSNQTNLALGHCTGDWAFYLQSDEVVHERYLGYLQVLMRRYLGQDRIEGLEFKYRHFYGTYDHYQDNYRRWYPREVRIIRRRDNIVSWDDAKGFRHRDGSRINAVPTKAEIFHYGWVKPPEQMLFKSKSLDRYWHDDAWIAARYEGQREFAYPDRHYLVRFRNSHPSVMRERIARSGFKLTTPRSLMRCFPVRKLAVLMEPLLKRAGIRL